MQFRWLAGFVLIVVVLMLGREQITRVQNDQGSRAVKVGQADIDIPATISAARAVDSKEHAQLLQTSLRREASTAKADLKAKFDAHIHRAESGDAASMVIVADISLTCAGAWRYKDWDQYASQGDVLSQFSPDESDRVKAWFDDLVARCGTVNERVPTGGEFAYWAVHWYEEAAAAGNPVAGLFMLFGAPPNEANRKAMAVLLKEGMATPDYRIYEMAQRFYFKYPAVGLESSDVVRESWSYLACLHRTECSTNEMLEYFDMQYSPAEAAAIIDAAEFLEHGGAAKVDFLSSSAFEPTEEN